LIKRIFFVMKGVSPPSRNHEGEGGCKVGEKKPERGGTASSSGKSRISRELDFFIGGGGATNYSGGDTRS